VILDGQPTQDDSLIHPGEAVLKSARFLKSPEVERVQRALAAIEVHVPLDLRCSGQFRTQAPPPGQATQLASRTGWTLAAPTW
jgi:hypothetical protein